ncbi:winged helix DNA-binding domain-containing protein [Actinophytocola gossypii]|uniref:AlkZ family DNA glycosylase n=1 Tax=Actinophytocola gossypii TaxID=2812003 RepID=A0ABT2J6J1_9PSEU|nr:winged helix DNA-binding domain-containing protein [Actinophytocola gossypii]MCT2583396.1 AlkZ family DNA glycosylase [Actinophytocola gossypii]
METFTWAEVCARRLARHRLAGAPADDVAEVVRALAGVHAQVPSAAELSIGLRLAGATRETVRHALWTEHSLIRTFGPRGTVHLLPARDLAMWTGALAEIPLAAAQQPPHVRMTAEQTEQVLAAIEDAVADAELTVDELSDAVVAACGSWAGDPVMDAFQGKWPRWRQVMHLAGMRGALCFAPNRGRKVTYTSPRRWLPGFNPAGGALPDVLRAYLHVFGPATPARFANWLAAPRAWARGVFADHADALERVLVDGEEAWVNAGDTARPTEPPSGLRLLPYFDGYAYAVGNDRARLYPGRAATRAKGNFQVLLVDGVVAGLWHQRRAGRKVQLTVEPFGRVRRADLDEQAERVGAVLGATPELTVGEVTVGGHA